MTTLMMETSSKKLKTRKSDKGTVVGTAAYDVNGERVVMNAIAIGNFEQVYVTSDEAELPFVLGPKQVLDMTSEPRAAGDVAVSLVGEFMVKVGMISQEELDEARELCHDRINNADAIDAERVANALTALIETAGSKVTATTGSKGALETLHTGLSEILGHNREE